MKSYSHALEQFTGKINAAMLLENAMAELNELQDTYSKRGGAQNHRTAVLGKKLSAMVHGRNIYNQSNFPWLCEVRVDGQYIGYASTHLSSRTDAENLCNDFNALNPDGLVK
jgi:hypothetical protein